MKSLADFEFNKAPLCDGMILASENIRKDFPSCYVYDELNRLVSLAQEEIGEFLSQDAQLEKLLALLWRMGIPANAGRVSSVRCFVA